MRSLVIGSTLILAAGVTWGQSGSGTPEASSSSYASYRPTTSYNWSTPQPVAPRISPFYGSSRSSFRSPFFPGFAGNRFGLGGFGFSGVSSLGRSLNGVAFGGAAPGRLLFGSAGRSAFGSSGFGAFNRFGFGGYGQGYGFGNPGGIWFTPYSIQQLNSGPTAPSFANPAPVKELGELPAPLATPARPSTVSDSAAWKDLQSRFSAASADVSAGRRSVEELRNRLAAIGQSPRAELDTRIALAETELALAQDEMTAGNLAEARSAMQRARALAQQVLKEFGR